MSMNISFANNPKTNNLMTGVFATLAVIAGAALITYVATSVMGHYFTASGMLHNLSIASTVAKMTLWATGGLMIMMIGAVVARALDGKKALSAAIRVFALLLGLSAIGMGVLGGLNYFAAGASFITTTKLAATITGYIFLGLTAPTLIAAAIASIRAAREHARNWDYTFSDIERNNLEHVE